MIIGIWSNSGWWKHIWLVISQFRLSAFELCSSSDKNRKTETKPVMAVVFRVEEERSPCHTEARSDQSTDCLCYQDLVPALLQLCKDLYSWNL